MSRSQRCGSSRSGRSLPKWYGAAGAATALAVLVRPNLAPLAALPLVWIAWTASRDRRTVSALRFSWPVAIAAAVVAGLQWRWYGSPFLSGYGAAGELFTLSNVVPNARLYGSWMWEAEPVFVLTGALALAAILAMRIWPAPGMQGADATTFRTITAIRPAVIALSVFAFGVVAAYLVYAVFERWSYVRFLLPAYPQSLCYWQWPWTGSLIGWRQPWPACWSPRRW